jgi:hypothetical protein
MIIFCNSTGKPKRAESSGGVCSLADEPSEAGCVMVGMSRSGVCVALSAVVGMS